MAAADMLSVPGRRLGDNVLTCNNGSRTLTACGCKTDHPNYVAGSQLQSAGGYTVCAPPNWEAWGLCQLGASVSCPTASPTVAPTPRPTVKPTSSPTSSPTTGPTTGPTGAPTTSPTTGPTANLTSNPSTSPSTAPTSSPTIGPTTFTAKATTANLTTSPTSFARSLSSPPDNLVDSPSPKKNRVRTTGIIVAVTLVAAALLFIGVGILCRKRAAPGDAVGAATPTVNVQLSGGVAVAETSAGGLFFVPLEADQPGAAPAVYEKGTPFGLPGATPQEELSRRPPLFPQPQLPLGEDGYVADRSQGATRPVDADGYVFDKSISNPTQTDAVYSVPVEDGYMTVVQSMMHIAQSADTDAVYSVPVDDDYMAVGHSMSTTSADALAAAPTTSDVGTEPVEQDDGYEPVEQDGASPVAPAPPYEAGAAHLPRPAPKDYVRVDVQKPYEDTEL